MKIMYHSLAGMMDCPWPLAERSCLCWPVSIAVASIRLDLVEEQMSAGGSTIGEKLYIYNSEHKDELHAIYYPHYGASLRQLQPLWSSDIAWYDHYLYYLSRKGKDIETGR